MQLKRPTHATVVAYLALFAALGGTAIAARDNLGAKELDQLVVRDKSVSPTTQDGHAEAVARCRKGEQFISGAGGWQNVGGVPPATVSSAVTVTGRRAGRPAGFLVKGDAPALNNTLVAQALCLPK